MKAQISIHQTLGAVSRALVEAVRRAPVLSFFLLACLFGWLPHIAGAAGHWSSPENIPLGPLPAALIVTACQGRAELRAWSRQLRSWGATPQWYLLALIAPALVHLVNVLVNHGLGAPLPTSAQLADWPQIAPMFLVFLVLVGIGEEAGWTAFAAPILLRRHPLLVAWVVASSMRIAWHLPMMINGDLPWVLGTVGNAGFTMVTLLVFLASGRRWTPVAVWHASLNVFGSAFLFTMVTGDDQARLGFLLAGAYVVVAAVGYVAYRQLRGTQVSKSQERQRFAAAA